MYQLEKDQVEMVAILKNGTQLRFIIPSDGKFLKQIYDELRKCDVVLLEDGMILMKNELSAIVSADCLNGGRVPARSARPLL